MRAPLKVADGDVGTPFDHMALEGDYRLTRDGDDWFLAEGSTTKDRFTPTPRRLDDFADACRYALEERFDFVLEEVSCTSDDS